MKKTLLILALFAAGLDGLRAADDIVATAQKAGQFKTLTAAVKEAGLTATLKGPGPFTVFAPTDEAFGQIPEGHLGRPDETSQQQKLASILEAHVLQGKVMAKDVKTMTATTVGGAKIKVTKKRIIGHVR
jgi:uncharacterized surface protein with fasciclin (FAS1) repeats